MKPKRRIFALLFVFITTMMMCISANAESVTNEGLTAEIIADNNYYKSDETADILVKLTNNNDFTVYDVSIESLIPEGLVMVDNSKKTSKINELQSGQVLSLKVKVAQDSSRKPNENNSSSETESIIDTENTDTQSDDTSSSSKVDSSIASENKITTTTSNNTNSVKPSSNTTSNVNNVEDTTAFSTGGDIVENRVLLLFVLALIFVVIILVTNGYSKKKTVHRIMSITLALVFSLSFVTQIKVAAETVASKFTVNEIIRFEKNVYNFVASVNYGSIYTDSSVTYTRGEWVKLIAEIEGYTVDKLEIDTDEYDFYFGDTKGTEDGILFEYVNSLGAIPYPDNEGYEDPEQDIPLFEADRTVTREYAAYSVIKLMGFVDESPTLNCSDAANINYPSQVTTALKFGMLDLINGNFCPNFALSQADRNQITAVMKALDSSIVISDDEVAHEVNFKDGVIADELSSIINYSAVTNDGSTYTVILPLNENTKSIKEGTVFVLPENDEYPNGASFKASNVTVSSSNVKVIATIPEWSDVAVSVYLKDTVQPSVSDFIPADDVFAEIVDSSERSGDSAPIDLDKHFNSDQKLEVTKKIKLNGDDKLEVKLSFLLPEISVVYKSHVDWDWLNTKYVVDEALFAVKKEVTVEGSYIIASGDQNDVDSEEGWVAGLGIIGGSNGTGFMAGHRGQTPDQLKLGVVPVNLPAGFRADVNVYLKAEASGKFTLGYSFQQTSGLHYINGSIRNLKDSRSSWDKIELVGEAKIGPKVALDLTWTVLPELIGVQIFAGAGVKGALTVHPGVDIQIVEDQNQGHMETDPSFNTGAGLICVDARIYMLLELGISENTEFGKLLDGIGVEANWAIFNEDNSPVKKVFHLESKFPELSIHKVDECTYGTGSLVINVKDSDGNTIPLSKITAISSDKETKKTDYTDSSGMFTVNGLSTGPALVEVIATGYKKYSGHELIKSNQVTYAEIVLMVQRSDEMVETESGIGTNYAVGEVKDAITGDLIDAHFTVKTKYNSADSSDIVAEGDTVDGKYSVVLPVGYYSITFTKDGYINSSVNVTIKASDKTEKNVVISPELGNIGVDKSAQMRIVLTWGKTPSDLDSHLLSTENYSYHIYFSNKTYRREEKVAELDVDETKGYGPETVTIYSVEPNEKFSYYVHDYTNKGQGSSTEMSQSGARVVVYSGETPVAVYNTPINIEGDLWHVFDYDPSNGEITPVNTYNNISASEYGEYFINKY